MEKRNGPKKKKKRDPRAPRAAAVPYTFFFKEFRPQFKAQNRDASIGESSLLLGAAWRNLPEEEKQV
ncbi:hypothetical protein JH06_1807 [Blastocystis sp. subtype 4]|uniref:hypothetical protein n=1 Tax=Blastocystis sp. subtype 4 TaxID=944170 RepID=UPI0007112EC8|nr:hypothetical protein JH06_1807 [Blastocystis sp. subtype 4]KNB45591.1 hypothetical protein JH06_1807 [Blastocystis sp. subtype 4]|eukprot:XP_014529031.1 hypothetical protein JH06_1807 [Blastocystis sp. subtype 4]